MSRHFRRMSPGASGRESAADLAERILSGTEKEQLAPEWTAVQDLVRALRATAVAETAQENERETVAAIASIVRRSDAPKKYRSRILRGSVSPVVVAIGLFVGGTIYRKAFDVLLDAYCATFSPSDDVCLVVKDSLAGGHYQGMTMGAAIAERSRDPGSPAIEVIDGDLSDGDLAALYRACDVLILASRGEAFGLPAAEAMACGKPVMVTAGTGCADFADEDVAWVIPSTSLPLEVPGHLPATGTFRVLEPDREHLSRALLSAASDERVRREKASCARRRIVEGFTWEHMAARVDALLHELTGDGRG